MRFKPTDGSNLTIPASVQVPRLAKNIQFEFVAGTRQCDFVVQAQRPASRRHARRDEAAARQEPSRSGEGEMTTLGRACNEFKALSRCPSSVLVRFVAPRCARGPATNRGLKSPVESGSIRPQTARTGAELLVSMHRTILPENGRLPASSKLTGWRKQSLSAGAGKMAAANALWRRRIRAMGGSPPHRLGFLPVSVRRMLPDPPVTQFTHGTTYTARHVLQ